MTKPISSRSVKGTPKTDEKQGSNGTPLIDPDSASIYVSSPKSDEVTGWTIQFEGGAVQHVRVRGGRGRVSYSSGVRGQGGEVRIYRNESTKVFDAAFSGVVHIVSDRVETFPVVSGRDEPRVNRATGTTPIDAIKESMEQVRLEKESLEEKERATLHHWAGSLKTIKKRAVIRPSEPLNPEDFKKDTVEF